MADWTEQELIQLKSLHDRYLDDGFSGAALADKIAGKIGRTADGVKMKLFNHFKLGLTKPNVKGKRGRARKKVPVDSEVMEDQCNTDPAVHPYFIAADILSNKPGVNAEVRDGVCYRNGHPWPAMKFLAEAGVELPQ